MSEQVHPGGRPPKFDTPEQLEQAIKEYFTNDNKPFTITGIALWLGFCDRQSLYDYEKKPEFSCMIKEARLRVENAYEEKLSANNPTGSIFALKNMGWRDKVETGFTDTEGKDRPVQIIQLPSNSRDVKTDITGE